MVEKPHISREDLDADGFGYWPEEAQAAIIRRDEKIVSLEEQYATALDALRSIEATAGAGGSGEIPAMPIAAKAREVLFPASRAES